MIKKWRSSAIQRWLSRKQPRSVACGDLAWSSPAPRRTSCVLCIRRRYTAFAAQDADLEEDKRAAVIYPPLRSQQAAERGLADELVDFFNGLHYLSQQVALKAAELQFNEH